MKLRPAAPDRPAHAHRKSAKLPAQTRKSRQNTPPATGQNPESNATSLQTGGEVLHCLFTGSAAIVAEALEAVERLAPATALAGPSGPTSLMATRFAVQFVRPEPMSDDYISAAIIVAR